MYLNQKYPKNRYICHKHYRIHKDGLIKVWKHYEHLWMSLKTIWMEIRTHDIKSFLMLNSAEHEISMLDKSHFMNPLEEIFI